MSIMIFMIPLALLLGLLGLAAFIWSLKANQYEDLEGAANRILIDDEESENPLPSNPPSPTDDRAG